MKNFKTIAAGFFLFILISCKNEAEKAKVSYNKNPKKEIQAIDTTKIQVADLPIQFDGTKFLIFPIGNLNSYNRGNKSSYETYSNSDYPVSFKVSNNMENEITGYLSNLKFQNIDKDTLITLTQKPILLQSVTFLKNISDKTKQQFLVYLLADSDSNQDGRLDTNDIKSLYISEISGDRFTKISVDDQETIDWKTVDFKNRLFFRTIEDTNKDGKFNKNDKVHYYFVNLLDKEWKPQEFQL